MGAMNIIVKNFGVVDYASTFESMKHHCDARASGDPDEIWLVEHPSVYTQGVSGKAEHIRQVIDIPVVQTNRGGQVTYHGPGQIVAYPLIDLRRLNIFVKEYVYRLEEAVIKTLLHFDITGHRIASAPGVYVNLEDPFGNSVPRWPQKNIFDGFGKIAALGIKVSRHVAYHGLSLNVDMDLRPFDNIHPCGYQQLRVVAMSQFGARRSVDDVRHVLGRKLSTYLS